MFLDRERSCSVVLELSHLVWCNRSRRGQAQKAGIRGMLYPRAEAIMARVGGQDSCLLSPVVIPPAIVGGWQKGSLLQVISAIGFFPSYLMNDCLGGGIITCDTL